MHSSQSPPLKHEADDCNVAGRQWMMQEPKHEQHGCGPSDHGLLPALGFAGIQTMTSGLLSMAGLRHLALPAYEADQGLLGSDEYSEDGADPGSPAAELQQGDCGPRAGLASIHTSVKKPKRKCLDFDDDTTPGAA